MKLGRWAAKWTTVLGRAPHLVVSAALLLAGCSRSGAEAPPESEAARLARDGRARLAEGDKKAARAHFQRAVEVGPKEAHGRLGLALLEMLDGNTPAAQDQLVALRAGGLDPGREAPWLVTLLDARRHFPAAEALVKVDGSAPDVTEPPPEVVQPPEPAPSVPTEADAPLVDAFRRGDYEAVRRAVEPESSPTLFRQKLLADAYYNLQDWTRAVRTYRLVLRKEPSNEPVTQYLADALVRLGRYDDAIGFYRVLAEANPTRPGFWRLIGDAATAKGDAEVALASYLRAVSAGYDDANVNAAIEALKARLAAAAGAKPEAPPPLQPEEPRGPREPDEPEPKLDHERDPETDVPPPARRPRAPRPRPRPEAPEAPADPAPAPAPEPAPAESPAPAEPPPD